MWLIFRVQFISGNQILFISHHKIFHLNHAVKLQIKSNIHSFSNQTFSLKSQIKYLRWFYCNKRTQKPSSHAEVCSYFSKIPNYFLINKVVIIIFTKNVVKLKSEMIFFPKRLRTWSRCYYFAIILILLALFFVL